MRLFVLLHGVWAVGGELEGLVLERHVHGGLRFCGAYLQGARRGLGIEILPDGEQDVEAESTLAPRAGALTAQYHIFTHLKSTPVASVMYASINSLEHCSTFASLAYTLKLVSEPAMNSVVASPTALECAALTAPLLATSLNGEESIWMPFSLMATS